MDSQHYGNGSRYNPVVLKFYGSKLAILCFSRDQPVNPFIGCNTGCLFIRNYIDSMQFEDFALYTQIPSYGSSQSRILLFWKPNLVIPIGFDIFIGRFVQVHVESSHQSGNNQIQFCRCEATWCWLVNVKDSIEVDIEEISYLIPRHCLGPLEKATSMLSKRSPFS